MLNDEVVPAPVGAMGVLDSVAGLVSTGGPVVVVLLAISVFALAISLAKIWQFRVSRLGDTRAADEALRLHRLGRTAEAVASAEGSPNPAARVLEVAMRGKHARAPEDRVREDVMRVGGDLLQSLRSWLRPLEVIASVSPLLGLFGTVLGMIEAFRQLEAAGNQVDPAILSGGIWEALLTTAVGLGVAIPVVAVLNWLESRIATTEHRMQSAVLQVFTQELAQAEEPLVRNDEVRSDVSSAPAASR